MFHSMKISVIGTGYLGATHAAAMAELGHEVRGVDVDAAKVHNLRQGRVPFFEPGLPELVERHVASGRLIFSTAFASAAKFADVHFVCVGTPQRADGMSADLSYLEEAIDGVLEHARPGSTIVGKSTVPVGTATRLAEKVRAAGCVLVWNPEFLREGFGVEDTLRPDRVVIGADAAEDAEALKQVYAPILATGTPLIETDFATAELVKVAANSFLATKISFINAMAEVCEATGADVAQLSTAIGHDERIGHHFLKAGVGFGGGCLPKDIRAFLARAEELGVDRAVSFLRDMDQINSRRRVRAVALARELCGGTLSERKIAVLGAAFKPNSDDVRDSPALDVAGAIRAEGAEVRVYDPQAMHNAKNSHPGLFYAASALDACLDADVVLHLTEWSEFADLDPARLAEVVAAPRLVDGRNGLDLSAWMDAGWTVRVLGRPEPGTRTGQPQLPRPRNHGNTTSTVGSSTTAPASANTSNDNAVMPGPASKP